MSESYMIQRCMAALHAQYVLSDDEARGMADVVLSTAQAVKPHPRGAMGYLHRLKGSEDWNISLPYGMATAWEYQKLYPSNIEIVPLYTEAGADALSRVGYQELFKAIGDAVTVQPDGKSISISVKSFRMSLAKAKDDEIKSSDAMARWVIDQWRISCAVELIPSIDILEGHISTALASHTSALAERDAEIARLREYYEAREELARVGMFDATDEMWSRVNAASAALAKEPTL